MTSSNHELPDHLLATLKGHTSAICFSRFSSDGNYCLSGGYDKTIRLWNPHKEKEIRQYLGHNFAVLDLDIRHDNNAFISCGEDKQPYLWDVESAKIVRKFEGHSLRINCIRYNKDCQIFGTGSYDKSIKIWDCRSRNYKPIQTMMDAKDSISSLCFTDSEIITCSIDGCIRIYDIRKSELKTDFLHHPVTSISLSIDGNVILASCLDSTIRLIDKDDGSIYTEYTGHKNNEFKIESVFSNDDAYVVSGSEDGYIYFWGLEEGNVVLKYKAHEKLICGVTYHPREVYLLSVSSDCTIKLWGKKPVT